MRSGFRMKRDRFNLKLESWYRKKKYTKKAKIRIKRMDGGFDCTKEYEEIVKPYWARFGLKPKKLWWQIFADREKKVDPRYIPDDLWYGDIIPYFSNPDFRRFAEDKCMHDIFFPHAKRPETIVKNMAGVFYDKDWNLLTLDEAVKLCENLNEEFLIKPSIDSGEARLIKFFEPGKYKVEDVRSAIDEMKSNFIIQKSIKQHPDIGQLNESSLNTIRIVSFLFENEVYILSSILRIGAENSKIDNVGAGGFAVPIDENGCLSEKGVNRKADWVSENRKGIKFKGIKIPDYYKLVDFVKKTHSRMAHFKIIGWDMSIDIDRDPVFIEYNTCPGPNQITCGPTFGDLTDRVLQEVYVDKKLRYAQN